MQSNAGAMRVLWTGGWDSTFRIAHLAKWPVAVQPIYFVDRARKSTEIEQRIIAQLLGDIGRAQDTKWTMLPMQYLPVGEVAVPPHIQRSYDRLRAEYRIGKQYRWLAAYAERSGPIELCLVKDSKFDALFTKEKWLLSECDATGKAVFRLDAEKADPDFYTIFGNMRFPVVDLSKRDMQRIAEQDGTIALLAGCWFCHEPLRGETCGLCMPCKEAVQYEVAHRLSAGAKRRYRLDAALRRMLGSGRLYQAARRGVRRFVR